MAKEKLELGKHYPDIKDTNESVESLSVQVLSAIDSYKSIREKVFTEEESLGEKELVDAKEKLALLFIKIYNLSPNLSQFEETVRKIIAEYVIKFNKDPEEYLRDATLFPGSLKDSNIRSPIESLVASIENLKRIGRLAEISEPYLDGLVIGGSMAYGPFFSVKSDRKILLSEEFGINIESGGEVSDIDGLMLLENFHNLPNLIDGLIKSGLCSPEELRRSEKFLELWKNGQADIFSYRYTGNGVEESFHILDGITLGKILDNHKHIANKVGHLKDFRPNIPSKSPRGYYRLIGMRTGKEIKFPISIEEISDKLELPIGYISDTPTGGFMDINGIIDYYPSVLTHILLMSPIIPSDRHNKLDGIINNLATEINSRIDLGDTINIYRHQRMPKNLLKEVAKSIKSHE